MSGGMIMEIIGELIVRSRSEPEMIFKSEQRDPVIGGETDEYEKRAILERLLIVERKFSEFFERFGRFLNESHLNWFAIADRIDEKQAELTADERFLIRAYIRNLLVDRKRSTIRNRRFAFVMENSDSEDFFSEYEMARRAPELYQQLIGQYLTDDERNSQFLNSNLTLFDLLSPETEMIFGRETVNRTKTDRKRQEENSGGKPKRQLWGEMETEPKPELEPVTALKINADELEQNRFEFRTLMIERFLNGKDADCFDYSRTDTATGDDHRQRDQDLEDAYFDAD